MGYCGAIFQIDIDNKIYNTYDDLMKLFISPDNVYSEYISPDDVIFYLKRISSLPDKIHKRYSCNENLIDVREK